VTPAVTLNRRMDPADGPTARADGVRGGACRLPGVHGDIEVCVVECLDGQANLVRPPPQPLDEQRHITAPQICIDVAGELADRPGEQTHDGHVRGGDIWTQTAVGLRPLDESGQRGNQALLGGVHSAARVALAERDLP